MPRTARQKSESGIYHIMLRGADRRIIFSDDEDHTRFIEYLVRAKSASKFQLYAYCLMGNHVHILLRECEEPLEQIIKRVGSSYVFYYNRKYDLYGHLFQDRFRSEPIETDAYFADVLRYICQNPVKAGLSAKPEEYPWLRCSGIHNVPELDSITELTELSGAELMTFINSTCHDDHLDYTEPKRLSDRAAIALVCSLCDCSHVQEIGGWSEERRNNAIRKAHENGISIRQFSRLTGISKAVIERTLKKK